MYQRLSFNSCAQVFTRKYQLSLQPEAVALLEEIIDEHEIEPDQVQDAVEAIAKEYVQQDDCGTIVTKRILERVYDAMRLSGEDGSGAGTLDAESLDPDHHLFVIDAFDMPSWNYSLERKTFERYLTPCVLIFLLLDGMPLEQRINQTSRARQIRVPCLSGIDTI